MRRKQPAVFGCPGAALGIEHQRAARTPEPCKGLAVVTEVLGAVQRRLDEGERRSAPRSHAVKLLPQPQVDFAFGLRMVNCAPCRLST